MPLREITLTPSEKKLINKIKTYALTLPSITPRIAGGWIRDKLLGKNTNDIDITINRISGYDFAIGMQKYYSAEGSVGKIKANPEKSKHLETAVMKIDDISVDFLSLRMEEYFDTRIPMIKSCTAEEDAFRRDLTINSLFYNIIKEEVEDFTGHGISDLEQGIIRTPMDSLKTLLDDPLRLLRIIRFSVRFKFKIHRDILTSFQNEQIHSNLTKKISNERVGLELYKILDYDNFIDAFKIIVNYSLVPAVFKKQFCIDEKMLMKIHENYGKLQRYFTFDHKIARLYVILLYNATQIVENTFSNFIVVKKNLCYGKDVFSKVKVLERNLCLLKKIRKKMTVEDAVFLVRHMREDYELSFFIYLIAADYQPEEINNLFRFLMDDDKICDECSLSSSNNCKCSKRCGQDANELNDSLFYSGSITNETMLSNTANSSDTSLEDTCFREKNMADNECLTLYANNNKHLIVHILKTILPYKKDLFLGKFSFDGRVIHDSLKIDKTDISFYLEMAKVQQIVHKMNDQDVIKRLYEIKKCGRINGFKKFYLTNIF